MSRWLATGALLAGLMVTEVVMALPAELANLRPLGQGNLRWFGFKLYDATLYTQQGQSFDWARPFALSLRYARDIPSAKIVDISLEEMQRYGLPENRRTSWREALAAAIPDVRQGDEIVGAFDGNSLRFWHNGRPTRTVDDPLLARTFFRIWLDPASRAPALREQLLNGRG
jgi:hypothetical protein